MDIGSFSLDDRERLARETDLSSREGDVALLMLLGFKRLVIARALHIKERTVATYAERLYAKLAIHSRADLVMRLLCMCPWLIKFVPAARHSAAAASA